MESIGLDPVHSRFNRFRRAVDIKFLVYAGRHT